MNAVLSRRSVGCVSDLTIDRWLLGETPGSDEARRVEEHVKTCANCSSRLGALRGLYSTQVTEPGHDRPAKLEQLPARTDGQTGALQIMILRDGLLVGAEFFTPGAYVVGGGALADLQLEGLAPAHATLHFQSGRVAMKADEGALFVNGFKVSSAELRPIDEVLVGPYVLRSRVIRERWSDPEHPSSRVSSPAAAPHEALAEAPTVIIEGPRTQVTRPPPSKVAKPTPQVTLELYWGDTRQDAKSFTGPVQVADFQLWGFDAVVHDFVLAEPRGSGFVVRAPKSDREVMLEVGRSHSVTQGAMTLVWSVGLAAPALPRAALVSWPLFSLTSVLLLALFGGMALAPVQDESAFQPRPLPPRIVGPIFVKKTPPPPPPPLATREPTAVTPSVKPHSRPSAPAAGAPPRTDRFSMVDRVLSGNTMKKLMNSTPSAGRKGEGRQTLFAGLGMPAGASKGMGSIGLPGDGGGIGIGAGGLKTGGAMNGGNYGKGPVGGTVSAPNPIHVGVEGGAAKGSIDRDAVARVIAEHLREVQACYEHALLTNGQAGGRLHVEWTVTTSGDVAQAKVKSTNLRDGSIASCVLTHLKAWHFPVAHGSSVVVSYPFVFQASAY